MENKETVIIVHGTWANPTSTATRASLTTTSGATRHPPALSAGDMTPRNAAAFSYVNVQFRFTRVAADCVHDAFTPVHQSTLLEPAFC